MGPPRVKPKNRLIDRRAEICVFSMIIFKDISEDISMAISTVASATDTGDAKRARGAMLGGDGLNMLATISKIQAATSLKDQMDILKKVKSDLKTALMEPIDPEAPVDISKSVELLLRLFLSPEGFVLRKSLDWIGELMSRSQAISSANMQALVVKSCLAVLDRALLEVQEAGSAARPELLMGWVHSLNTMGLLDRELPWLDSSQDSKCTTSCWPLVPELGLGSLYSFVKVVLVVFRTAALAVATASAASGEGALGADGEDIEMEEESPKDEGGILIGAVASVARYAECAGEVMRVLNIAMKARRAAFVAPVGSGNSSVSDMWIALLDGPEMETMNVAAELLVSNIISKDVVASTALGTICLQWISRHYLTQRVTGGAESGTMYTPDVGVSQFGVIISTVRAYYMEVNCTASVTSGERSRQALAAGFHPSLAAVMGTLPLDAACALFRAALSVFEDSTLMCRGGQYNMLDLNESVPSSEKSKNIMLYGGIYDAIMELCIHRAPEIQAAGMQTLEAWINRVEIVERARKQTSFDGMAGKTRAEEMASKIGNACKVISRSWSHPAKNINHLVPVVYQRLVDLMALLDEYANTRPNTVQNDKTDIWWPPLIKDALMQPVHHRGRYQALSFLLPRVGAVRFLQSHPQIIVSLTESMRVRDVSSAASALLGDILNVVKKSLPYSDFRNLWEPHVVKAICSPDAKMRLNAVDYLIPEMIKVDAACCPRLINRVRALSSIDSTEYSLVEVQLFAIVHIVLQARLHNVAGQKVENVPHSVTEPDSGHDLSSILNIIASSLYLGGDAPPSIRPDVRLATAGLLQATELAWACVSEDVDLRLTAITAITSSQLTLQPISPIELHILRETIGYSMKTATAEDRHRLIRAVRSLLLRLRETCRAAERDLRKITKAASAKKAKANDKEKEKVVAKEDDQAKPTGSIAAATGPSKEPSRRSRKQAAAPLDESTLLDTLNTGHDTCIWLSAAILGNLYPGAPSEREVVALELYLLVLDTFSTEDGSDEAMLLRHFISTNAVKALVNMLVSTWDRTRKLAADALAKLPRPLCGVGCAEEVGSLVIWGSRLSGSSRQRESDAGALMLRVVMSIYAIHLGWDINVLHPGSLGVGTSAVPSSPLGSALPIGSNGGSEVSVAVLESAPAVSRLSSATAAARFISGLCDLMSIRLQGLETLFSTLLMSEEGEDSVALAAAAPQEEPRKSEMDGMLELEEEMSEDASPLCHGLFLVLKYALDEVCAANLLSVYVPSSSLTSKVVKSSGGADESAWSVVLSRLLHLSQRGLDLALSVVAEAHTDVTFAPNSVQGNVVSESNNSQTATHDVGLSKGPTSVNSYMFLNTNSFMDNKLSLDGSKKTKHIEVAEEDMNGDGAMDTEEATIGGNIQRAVVGAWLLVKESSAFLARMVKLQKAATCASPNAPAEKDGEGNERTGALSNSDVEAIGTTLLDALGRLKHLGAISEAQQALMDICAHLLLLGEKNPQLCALPGRWLEAVLRRLENEQQVFILRRSAGFGYTFIALLRSEPPKIKSVLVPVALQRLLCIANIGLLREGVLTEESLGLPVSQLTALQETSSIGWRACVHAINVIRLLVLDGSIGPKMNAYVAQATIVAVKGFLSSRWAIRNSAMMLFSAVIQRAVDVDKKESGGRRAATAVEFFQRYPSLFPFLLQELADISDFKVVKGPKGEPAAVLPIEPEDAAAKPAETNKSSDAIHPSLFPILLLLSKFRAPTSSLKSAQLDGGAAVGGLVGARGIDLFIPLLESCLSSRVYQVREIAARAIPSLTALSQIPELLVRKIDALIPVVDKRGNPSSLLSSNQTHGKVLELYWLVSTLTKHIEASTSQMGNNRALYDDICQRLARTSLIPLQYLLTALTGVDFGNLTATRQSVIATGNQFTLTRNCNPAVMTLLVRILGMLVQLVGSGESGPHVQDLLVALSSLTLSDVLRPEVANAEAQSSALYSLHPPFTGVLHQEALASMLPIVFRSTLLCRKVKAPTHDGSVSDTPPGEAMFPFISKHCTCGCNETELSFCAVSVFLNLIAASPSNSEVRRGVLRGLTKVCSGLSNSVAESKLTNASVDGNVDTAKSGDAKPEMSVRQFILPFLLRHDILLRLLHQSIAEKEPPEALSSIELLCQILRVTDSSSLPDLMEKTAAKYVSNSFQAGGWAMWHMMKGQKHFSAVRAGLLKGETKPVGGIHSSRFLVTTLDYLSSRDLYDSYVTSRDGTEPFMAPTMNAACALEVLGWSICSLIPKFTFASREKTYTVNESKQMWRTHALLDMWIGMLELAIEEQMPAFCRVSAVKSIHMSKMLSWSVEYGIAVLCAHNGAKSTKQVNSLISGAVHNGEFACRLWLVVLQLMQDDDADIRLEMNKCLSEALSAFQPMADAGAVNHLFESDNVLKLSDALLQLSSLHTPEGPIGVDCGVSADVEDSVGVAPDAATSPPAVDTMDLPRGLGAAQGRSIESMTRPLAMCMMWSLLCDPAPTPAAKATSTPRAGANTSGLVAPTYGNREVLHTINGEQVFIAHRGIHHVLETFAQLGGGSVQPLMQFVMKESQAGADAQQIFEIDQANLHTESLTAVSILSSAFGIVANALPPSLTLGMMKFLFLRAEAGISMLQLSLQKMSWIGGSSFQPAVFNFAYSALCAGRMLRSSHPEANSSDELIDLDCRLRIYAYQLVRRSNQMLTNRGEIVPKPAQPQRRSLEDSPAAAEETSWYNAFSLSNLVSYVSSELPSTVGEESNRSESTLRSASRSHSVVSNSDCDNTMHSETAQLRAPILGGSTKIVGLHPMLVYLLHEIIMKR